MRSDLLHAGVVRWALAQLGSLLGGRLLLLLLLLLHLELHGLLQGLLGRLLRRGLGMGPLGGTLSHGPGAGGPLLAVGNV